MANADFQLFHRFSTRHVATALTDTPVGMLIGARQCGKTTLVRQFAGKKRDYVTLDNDTVLEATRPALCADSIWTPSRKCKELRNFCGPSNDQSVHDLPRTGDRAAGHRNWLEAAREKGGLVARASRGSDAGAARARNAAARFVSYMLSQHRSSVAYLADYKWLKRLHATHYPLRLLCLLSTVRCWNCTHPFSKRSAQGWETAMSKPRACQETYADSQA
jgi:ABC-type cobalamin/Fe3+-siderophores transport system ATPase subunit